MGVLNMPKIYICQNCGAEVMKFDQHVEDSFGKYTCPPLGIKTTATEQLPEALTATGYTTFCTAAFNEVVGGNKKYGPPTKTFVPLLEQFGRAGAARSVAEKMIRYSATGDKRDLLKAAAWIYLLWEYDK